MSNHPSNPSPARSGSETDPRGVRRIPVLPVRETVLFPHAVLPLTVGRESSIQLIEALGEDAVQEVVLAPIDERGQVNRARRRTVPVDTLVVGFGLRPSIELFQLLGCALRFDRMSGGWLPVRNVDLETSRPNVFAAGDGAGIGGVERALAEGRLVGMLAARPNASFARASRAWIASAPGSNGYTGHHAATWTW